jgi:hypothetical protein
MKQVREAVAVFHSVEDMEAAIDELLTHGFNRAEISLLAGENSIREKFGHSIASTSEMEDDPGAPEVPYLSRESFGSPEGYSIGLPLYVGAVIGMVPVIASGGAIAAVIAATVLGGGVGAAIGGIFAHLIGKHHAEFLETQLEKGGILVWVRTRDSEHEERAQDVLSRHSAFDVHIHGIPDKSAELKARYAKPELGALVPRMDHINYQNVQISKAADGHCLALGRLFASEAEARRYIDLIQREI